ncbi:MAG: efflux RND transporter periplasmic adaptor subunit [Hyphomicrobium sp.]
MSAMPPEPAVSTPATTGTTEPLLFNAPICRKQNGATSEPNGSTTAQTQGEASSNLAAAPPERKIKFYRNPMGLPDVSPVPKKDEMGMDYIPVYEDVPDVTDVDTIKIEPSKIQRIGVETVAATRQHLAKSIRAPGTVAIDEQRIFVIAPRFESFVENVSPFTTGSSVKKGDTLLELYGKELVNQGAWLLVHVNASADAPGSVPKSTLITASRRLQDLGAPDDFIEAIERERRVPHTVSVRAPRDGIVLERSVVPGQQLRAGDTAFRIADLSVVWVIADVPESEIANLKAGEAVTIRTRAHPGHMFSGTVALILPEIDLQTRTVKVRIEIDNAKRLLLPGMYADVEISAPEDAEVLIVPTASIIDTGDRQVVFVAQDGGRYAPHDVKVGRSGGGYAEVLQGLAEGDRIVTNGNFLIDAESNFQAAIKSFSTPRNVEARK